MKDGSLLESFRLPCNKIIVLNRLLFSLFTFGSSSFLLLLGSNPANAIGIGEGNIFIKEANDESGKFISSDGLLIPSIYQLDGDGSITVTAGAEFKPENIYKYFFDPTIKRADLIALFNYKVDLTKFKSDPPTLGDDTSAEPNEIHPFNFITACNNKKQCDFFNPNTFLNGQNGYNQVNDNSISNFRVNVHIDSPAEPRAEGAPEPFSILGSVTALGFGTYFKRKMKLSKSI